MKPTILSKPFEGIKCRNVWELRKALQLYGISNGYAELQKCIEGLPRHKTLDDFKAALLPFFPSVAKAAEDIIGGIYIRIVELESCEEALSVLLEYLEKRRKGNDVTKTMLALADKERFFKEHGMNLFVYIGLTIKALKTRILDDEACAIRGDLHGLQVLLYHLYPLPARKELQLCLLETGHWLNAPPAAAGQAAVATEDAFETREMHMRNAEKLFVALFDKPMLSNIDDGGKSAKALPPLMSGHLWGILGGDPLRKLHRCDVKWTLDADKRFLETEKEHLHRLIQPLMGRPLEAGERKTFPELDNLLPEAAVALISKSGYTKLRAKARGGAAAQEERERQLVAAQELGMDLLAKLAPGQEKTTVLVSCSHEGWLMLLDTLGAMGFNEAEVLGPQGYEHVRTRWSEGAQDVRLRMGFVRFRSARLGVNLWLFKTLNSTRAHHIGQRAWDHRAWAMAASIRLGQLLNQGLEPAEDARFQDLLLRLKDVDFEYRCANHVGKQLAAAFSSSEDGEQGEEPATGNGNEGAASLSDAAVSLDMPADSTFQAVEAKLRADFRATYDAEVEAAHHVDGVARVQAATEAAAIEKVRAKREKAMMQAREQDGVKKDSTGSEGSAAPGGREKEAELKATAALDREEDDMLWEYQSEVAWQKSGGDYDDYLFELEGAMEWHDLAMRARRKKRALDEAEEEEQTSKKKAKA